MLARLQQSVAVVTEGAVVATQATGGRIDQVFVWTAIRDRGISMPALAG